MHCSFISTNSICVMQTDKRDHCQFILSMNWSFCFLTLIQPKNENNCIEYMCIDTAGEILGFRMCIYFSFVMFFFFFRSRKKKTNKFDYCVAVHRVYYRHRSDHLNVICATIAFQKKSILMRLVLLKNMLIRQKSMVEVPCRQHCIAHDITLWPRCKCRPPMNCLLIYKSPESSLLLV